jgi:hypothetical protein
MGVTLHERGHSGGWERNLLCNNSNSSWTWIPLEGFAGSKPLGFHLRDSRGSYTVEYRFSFFDWVSTPYPSLGIVFRNRL